MTDKSKSSTYQVRIGGLASVSVGTLAEASALYRKYIASNGFGASDAKPCRIFAGGKQVAHVSYNGKVFPGATWFSGIVSLFEPWAVQS